MIACKHLVRCRCVMQQFKNMPEPPVHQFIVSSIVADDDKVVVKFAQCNNCGVIHKIVDICRSEIIQGKEGMNSLIRIDDIKLSLPQNLVMMLESNNADLPTWEVVQFIYENKRWGEFVVITSESESGMRLGKYVRIFSENVFKVDSFVREECVKEQ